MSFNPQKKRTFAFAALLMTALALGGCSSQLAELPIVGTSAEAPPRPGEQGAYLPVNSLPPERADTEMDTATRDKLKAELVAARNRQAAAKDAATK